MGEIVSGTLTADGDTSTFTLDTFDAMSDGIWFYAGTAFGGGTLTVKWLGDDGAFHDYPSGAFTASTASQIFVPRGTQIKATLSGSTTPTVYFQMQAYDSGPSQRLSFVS